jgi:tryptophanase
MCPHIPTLKYPGISLTVELYREAGIRGVEIGSVMFGYDDPDTGERQPARNELVRLAIPRRVYTQSHVDYAVEAIINVYERREAMRGYEITYEPVFLRHFTARFAPCAGGSDAG